MIHSARPIVSLVANIVFCSFILLDLKSGDGRKTCAQTKIPTVRDCGLAEWINICYQWSSQRKHIFLVSRLNFCDLFCLENSSCHICTELASLSMKIHKFRKLMKIAWSGGNFKKQNFQRYQKKDRYCSSSNWNTEVAKNLLKFHVYQLSASLSNFWKLQILITNLEMPKVINQIFR